LSQGLGAFLATEVALIIFEYNKFPVAPYAMVCMNKTLKKKLDVLCLEHRRLHRECAKIALEEGLGSLA